MGTQTPIALSWARQQAEILVPGSNCWVKPRAHRVSFLIDGAAYFAAFKGAVEKAQKTIYIAGWDIDSRVSLIRDSPEQIESTRLGPFLDKVISRTRGLRAYVLIWDFSMVFALEREPSLVFGLDWNTNRRIRFHMDGNHPLGASHHQKIVVVDDRVAFVGGFDLSRARWDTPDHIVDDPRRIDPPGKIYDPFHDIQVAVDGDAARALGDLFRRRWHQARTEVLSRPGKIRSDPWPEELTPDLQEVDVAIARTEPEYGNNPEVREVENLYIDAIYSARKHIYAESQYFTSASVCAALEKCLDDREGPEVLLIVPHQSSGWLEESIMDSRRALVIQQLTQADRFGRLGVYSPVLPRLSQGDMVIHSKLLIVDNELIRVGSSNLSNRSMGLDTECDLAIEASENGAVQKKIADLRNRLLAEHLGTTPEQVSETHQRTGSLIETVKEFQGSERTLVPLELKDPEWIESIAGSLVDSERPINPDKFLEQIVPHAVLPPAKSQLRKLIIVLLLLAALAALWNFGPLADWVDVGRLVSWGEVLRDQRAAVFVVPLAYLIGGLVMMPLVLLVVATALLFDPLTSVAYAYMGSMASALASYEIGRKLGRNSVRRFAGSKLNRISQLLAKQGILAVATVRLVPVAPFSLVNLVMGASNVRLRDYLVGTAIGLAPGICAISVFTESLYDAVSDPEPRSVGIVVLFVLLAIFCSIWIKRRLASSQSSARR